MSARVGIQLVPKISLPGMDRLLRAMDDWTEPLKGAVLDVRASVAREFRQGVWFMPSGGSRPWKRKQAYGNRPTGKTGIGTGDLLRAYQGQGRGGIVKVTRRTVTVGADASVLPYAADFRGGTGPRPSLSDMVIRPKKRANISGGRRVPWAQRWAMWWYHLFTFGVALSESALRRGLRVPTHPHLTKNPALVAKIRKRFAAHLKKAA